MINELTINLFSPFDTFVFLNIDEIRLDNIDTIRTELIKRLNEQEVQFNDKTLAVKWEVEEADYLTISREALAPTSKESSFLLGRLYEKDELNTSLQECKIPLKENIGISSSKLINFSNIHFYIHHSGVSSLSVEVRLESENGLSFQKISEISDNLRKIFKSYFQAICYEISLIYNKIVEDLNIPRYNFEYLPNITKFKDFDKNFHYLPWMHRVYYIEDKSLLEDSELRSSLEILLEPCWKDDIKNYSLKRDRFIYFGWGHSIIITQNKNILDPYHYIRVIEIAQVNWRSLELLIDLIDYAISYFRKYSKKLNLKEFKKQVYSIREFTITINRILDNFRGVKITFDVEKRYLLKELNIRWSTNEMIEKFGERLNMINSMLKDFHQRREERANKSISRILLIFTILTIIEIIGTILEIISPQITLDLLHKLLIIGIGTTVVTLIILYYLYKSLKKE